MDEERIQALEKRVDRIERVLSQLSTIRGASPNEVLNLIKRNLISFDSEVRREKGPYKPPPGTTLRRITPGEE